MRTPLDSSLKAMVVGKDGKPIAVFNSFADAERAIENLNRYDRLIEVCKQYMKWISLYLVWRYL